MPQGRTFKFQRSVAENWDELLKRVRDFLTQFTDGTQILLRYVGLLGNGKLAQAVVPP
jgi:hypothetical protein